MCWHIACITSRAATFCGVFCNPLDCRVVADLGRDMHLIKFFLGEASLCPENISVISILVPALQSRCRSHDTGSLCDAIAVQCVVSLNSDTFDVCLPIQVSTLFISQARTVLREGVNLLYEASLLST
jgi:hypothetical protein